MESLKTVTQIQAIHDKFIRAGLPALSPIEALDLQDRIDESPILAEIMNNFVDYLKAGSSLMDLELEHTVASGKNGYIEIIARGGKGKSEGAACVMLSLEEKLARYGRMPHFGFSRNYEETNDRIADATKNGYVLIGLQDEDDDEVGIGSATEEGALFTQMDSQRLLGHWIIRCSIVSKPRFAVRCRFILEPIFQDTTNRINYFLLYSPPRTQNEKWDKKPRAIVALPLHNDEDFRSRYREWKGNQAVSLALRGGRTSGIRGRLRPLIDAAIAFAVESQKEYTKQSDFEDCILWDIPHGDELIDAEVKKAAKRALKEYREFMHGYPVKADEPPEYLGQLTDLRQAIYDQLGIRGVESERIKAFKWYVGDGMYGMNQTDIAVHPEFQKSQGTIHNWIEQIRNSELGYAFEDVYAALLREQGIRFEKIGGNTPEPDIIIYDEKEIPHEIRSIKCYFDRKTTVSIPRKEVVGGNVQKKAEEWNVPVFLIYYDFASGALYEPILVENQERFKFSKRVVKEEELKEGVDE